MILCRMPWAERQPVHPVTQRLDVRVQQIEFRDAHSSNGNTRRVFDCPRKGTILNWSELLIHIELYDEVKHQVSSSQATGQLFAQEIIGLRTVRCCLGFSRWLHR